MNPEQIDEQRIQAYAELIQALLTCPGGQEAEILQQHRELVDAGLLQVMARYAAKLNKNGQTDAANFLVRLGTELAQALGIELPMEEKGADAPPSQDALQFLGELLQCIIEHQGNPQQVYPFFQANLGRLNGELLRVFPLMKPALENQSSEARETIAENVGEFGNLIQQFPLGNRLLNLELAVAAYELALQVYTRAAFPQQWATTQNNLAAAYNNRISGDRAENLEAAIHLIRGETENRNRQLLI